MPFLMLFEQLNHGILLLYARQLDNISLVSGLVQKQIVKWSWLVKDLMKYRTELKQTIDGLERQAAMALDRELGGRGY